MFLKIELVLTKVLVPRVQSRLVARRGKQVT